MKLSLSLMLCIQGGNCNQQSSAVAANFMERLVRYNPPARPIIPVDDEEWDDDE
jgi:hypothetical protein